MTHLCKWKQADDVFLQLTVKKDILKKNLYYDTINLGVVTGCDNNEKKQVSCYNVISSLTKYVEIKHQS